MISESCTSSVSYTPPPPPSFQFFLQLWTTLLVEYKGPRYDL